MSDERTMDPCDWCGLPDVVDGPDPAAHWDHPRGTEIVAWSCSAKCAARLEELREDDGWLKASTVAGLTHEVRVNVYMTLTVRDYEDGWESNVDELEGTVKATLHELNGDDGMAYVPHVYGIDADVNGI